MSIILKQLAVRIFAAHLHRLAAVAALKHQFLLFGGKKKEFVV